MGGVLCIPPAFAAGFLDLLGLRPTPTTDIHSTVGATVLCPWILENAAGAIRTFSAPWVRTYAVQRRLILSYAQIRFLFGRRARPRIPLFDCYGNDRSNLMGGVPPPDQPIPELKAHRPGVPSI